MTTGISSEFDRPLTREEMAGVIEGKGRARRVPIAVQHWADPSAFGEKAPLIREILNSCPCDFTRIDFKIPDVFQAPKDAPSYRWMNIDNFFPENTSLDAVTALQWDQLDAVLADFPDPGYPGLIPGNVPPDDGTYRVGLWWYWRCV